MYFTTIFRDFDAPVPQIQQAKEILLKYYPEESPDAIHLWGIAGAQVFTEALKRMGNENLIKALESIDNWTESVVPNVTIGEGNAPEHFIVKNMSCVVFKGGKFEEFKAPWEK